MKVKVFVKNQFLILFFLVVALAAFKNTLASSQTEQNFDALLQVYTEARIKYSQVSGMTSCLDLDLDPMCWENQEYWRKQYAFHRSRLLKLLNKYYDAARQNPKQNCYEALKKYSQYQEVNNSIILTDLWGSSSDDDFQFQRQLYLINYCGRYEIYYDPFVEPM